MGLELIAIALGLCSFSDFLVGTHIRIFSDNSGAESAARRGTAREFDHCCIAHSLWTKILHLHASVYVDRVPTEENLADLLSREEYDLLRWIGAVKVPARLDDRFYEPGAWKSLTLS